MESKTAGVEEVFGETGSCCFRPCFEVFCGLFHGGGCSMTMVMYPFVIRNGVSFVCEHVVQPFSWAGKEELRFFGVSSGFGWIERGLVGSFEF